MHTPRTRKRTLWIGLSLGALAFAGAVVGCAAHATVPARPEEEWSVSDPNVNPASTVMRLALERVITRFPVEGPYVINLPQGMQKRWAEDLLRRLNDPNANLVSTATADLPTYHVTKVWIRPGSRAWVDILRPVRDIGSAGGGPLYQRITVQLRDAPLNPWHVDATRVWPMGLDQPPPLFGWPTLEGTSIGEPITATQESVPEPSAE